MTNYCVTASHKAFLRQRTIINIRKYMTFSISYNIFLKKIASIINKKASYLLLLTQND